MKVITNTKELFEEIISVLKDSGKWPDIVDAVCLISAAPLLKNEFLPCFSLSSGIESYFVELRIESNSHKTKIVMDLGNFCTTKTDENSIRRMGELCGDCMVAYEKIMNERSNAEEITSAQIFTDGAARGNPDGPGGYGTILRYVDNKGKVYEREYSQGYVRTTNNRMELMAAIVGLEVLTSPCKVELYSDSKYLTDAFNQHWIEGWIRKGWKRGKNEPVKNIDLWKRLLKAKEPHEVTFIWVKGHDGHPVNERCDRLATSAADGDNLIVDEGV